MPFYQNQPKKPSAKSKSQEHFLKHIGQFLSLIAFFVGIAAIGLIDILIPEVENPHEYKGLDDTTKQRTNGSLMRTGLLTALAIGIHNFPEGLATFRTAFSDVKLGLFIAIAIHNIPEGISVSMPIFYATGSRRKVFFYSFLSGVAEPIGAIVGYLILMPFVTENLIAYLLALVAGIVLGMVVMAFGLSLF